MTPAHTTLLTPARSTLHAGAHGDADDDVVDAAATLDLLALTAPPATLVAVAKLGLLAERRRAETERQHAETERQHAETERQRARAESEHVARLQLELSIAKAQSTSLLQQVRHETRADLLHELGLVESAAAVLERVPARLSKPAMARRLLDFVGALTTASPESDVQRHAHALFRSMFRRQKAALEPHDFHSGKDTGPSLKIDLALLLPGAFNFADRTLLIVELKTDGQLGGDAKQSLLNHRGAIGQLLWYAHMVTTHCNDARVVFGMVATQTAFVLAKIQRCARKPGDRSVLRSFAPDEFAVLMEPPIEWCSAVGVCNPAALAVLHTIAGMTRAEWLRCTLRTESMLAIPQGLVARLETGCPRAAGRQCVVYKGTLIDTKRTVVVKWYADAEAAQREREMLRLFAAPSTELRELAPSLSDDDCAFLRAHVPRLSDADVGDAHVVLVEPWAEHASSRLMRPRHFVEAARVLDIVHALGYVHGDVALDNMLLCGLVSLSALLNDWAGATRIGDPVRMLHLGVASDRLLDAFAHGADVPCTARDDAEALVRTAVLCSLRSVDRDLCTAHEVNATRRDTACLATFWAQAQASAARADVINEITFVFRRLFGRPWAFEGAL